MKREEHKLRVLFVGSFAAMGSDGTVGGQMAACRALLESPLSSIIEWRLLDSTQKSQPPPNVVLRFFYALKRVLVLIRHLLNGGIDAVLIFSAYEPTSFLEKGLMCLLAGWSGKRVVLSIRSEIRSFASDRVLLGFRRRVIKKVDTVICQSEAAQENLQRAFGRECVSTRVIPNWIEAAQYKRPSPDEKTTAADARPLQFLFLGWVEEYKGVRELIEAAHILDEKQFDFRIVFCGGGSLLEPLQEHGAALGLEQKIEFKGWTTGEAKLDALWASDVLVLPSYSEGLPNALLEAMSAELAVVATPVGGVPSLIEPGVNGSLVAVKDAQALAEAMRELIMDRDKTRRMGRQSLEKVRRTHDVAQLWSEVARVLGADPQQIERTISETAIAQKSADIQTF